MIPASSSTRRRFAVLVAIAVVTASAVGAFIELKLSRPIGSGPAGPEVSAAPFETEWASRNVLLIGIGDSVTAGLGAKSPAHSYFNRILTNPPDEFPEMRGLCLSQVLPNVTAVNYAISGSTSDEHLRIIQEKIPVADEAFGLVVMTTGGNDLIHSYGRRKPRECAMYGATLLEAEPWIVAFRERLRLMLEEIDKRFPVGCEIYIGDIYDPTDGVGDAPSIFLPDWPDGLAIHRRYNAIIHDEAAKRSNTFVVGLYDEFLGHGSHCRQFWRSTYRRNDPHYWFYENVEDPNDRGYDAIRRLFLNAIARHTTLRQSS
ncbi:MAG: SGNH/GDSL hydrolase family protein [Pirellulaceae bacterium]